MILAGEYHNAPLSNTLLRQASVSDSVTEAKTSYETKFSDIRKLILKTFFVWADLVDGRRRLETSYNAADIK